jgi:Cu-processing system permease protein
MSNTLTLVRAVFLAQAREVMRNRWVLAYAVALALLTEAMFQLGGSGERALTGLLNVVLLLVPLVTTVFGVVYWHAAREFTELLLAQPVPRRALWFGLYFGLVLPLVAALVIGVAGPLALHRAITPEVLPLLAVYLLSGAMLTLCFGALALWIGARQDDRLKALGFALGVWFASTVAYDGLVVWFTTVYADWPLERPMLALMMANPVDLARTALMLRIDSAALMGYTGAVLSQVLGGTGGLVITAAALLGWAVVPAVGALRAFTRKDF